MSNIVSVIPNICEGKDRRFIEELSARLDQVPNLMMLDVSMDHLRNRTVFAFAGTREALFEGGFILYEEALKKIDMRKHLGQYPRIGAVDVFPFVPLKGTGIDETIEMSVEFAQEIVKRFNLPVYLFRESARFRNRRDIENIRDGEYEGFAEKMKDTRWKPDFGPDTLPPDSGATIIGARHPLISFKALLNSGTREMARAICYRLQSPEAGLRHVKANSGVDSDTGLPFITVAIHNFHHTPMYRVIECIRMEGRRFGQAIRKVEMIGLIPEVAFIDAAEYYMGIQGFDHSRLLERNIQQHLREKFLFAELDEYGEESDR